MSSNRRRNSFWDLFSLQKERERRRNWVRKNREYRERRERRKGNINHEITSHKNFFPDTFSRLILFLLFLSPFNFSLKHIVVQSFRMYWKYNFNSYPAKKLTCTFNTTRREEKSSWKLFLIFLTDASFILFFLSLSYSVFLSRKISSVQSCVSKNVWFWKMKNLIQKMEERWENFRIARSISSFFHLFSLHPLWKSCWLNFFSFSVRSFFVSLSLSRFQ